MASNKRQCTTKTFLDLPNEIIDHILSFIPPWQWRRSVIINDATITFSLSCVCHLFRDLIDARVTNLSVHNSSPTLTLNILIGKIIRCSKRLERLWIDRFYPTNEHAYNQIRDAVNSCASLQVLDCFPASAQKRPRFVVGAFNVPIICISPILMPASWFMYTHGVCETTESAWIYRKTTAYGDDPVNIAASKDSSLSIMAFSSKRDTTCKMFDFGDCRNGQKIIFPPLHPTRTSSLKYDLVPPWWRTSGFPCVASFGDEHHHLLERDLLHWFILPDAYPQLPRGIPGVLLTLAPIDFVYTDYDDNFLLSIQRQCGWMAALARTSASCQTSHRWFQLLDDLGVAVISLESLPSDPLESNSFCFSKVQHLVIGNCFNAGNFFPSVCVAPGNILNVWVLPTQLSMVRPHLRERMQLCAFYR